MLKSHESCYDRNKFSAISFNMLFCNDNYCDPLQINLNLFIHHIVSGSRFYIGLDSLLSIKSNEWTGQATTEATSEMQRLAKATLFAACCS